MAGGVRAGGHAWLGGMHGRGVWQGACVVGGVCGGGACMVGACMAGVYMGGHVWQGGMHGRGHAWQGGLVYTRCKTLLTVI